MRIDLRAYGGRDAGVMDSWLPVSAWTAPWPGRAGPSVGRKFPGLVSCHGVVYASAGLKITREPPPVVFPLALVVQRGGVPVWVLL